MQSNICTIGGVQLYGKASIYVEHTENVIMLTSLFWINAMLVCLFPYYGLMQTSIFKILF